MTKVTLQITHYGWFTCDAQFIVDGILTECPDFETIDELRDWVKDSWLAGD